MAKTNNQSKSQKRNKSWSGLGLHASYFLKGVIFYFTTTMMTITKHLKSYYCENKGMGLIFIMKYIVSYRYMKKRDIKIRCFVRL